MKLRYPDAPRSVRSDMFQLRALIPLMGRLLPTLDLKALLAEHTERLLEELDYRNEARWMTRFAEAWADEPYDIPEAVFASESVLVSRWLDGTPLSELIAAAVGGRARPPSGTAPAPCSPSSRSAPRSGSAPSTRTRTRATSGSPPTAAWACWTSARWRTGSGAFTELFAETAQLADDRRHRDAAAALDRRRDGDREHQRRRARGRCSTSTRCTRPRRTPPRRSRSPRTGSPRRAARWTDPAAALSGATKVRFPPSYLLEHRAVMGTFALLCQLRATVPMRDILDRAAPGSTVERAG